ncbi:hypothetical protein [Marinicauda sp. Alg238-R41]|uniref:hypothetical protein n=1 Tax=Marinicauda sp. Alg238-R41 TaxID=2993447 RepID=UPI0022E6DFEA|nr:hypothetical protein [Marinicauda sp. Alg238-R41]
MSDLTQQIALRLTELRDTARAIGPLCGKPLVECDGERWEAFVSFSAVGMVKPLAIVAGAEDPIAAIDSAIAVARRRTEGAAA